MTGLWLDPEDLPQLFRRCVICPDGPQNLQCPPCDDNEVCRQRSQTCNECVSLICMPDGESDSSGSGGGSSLSTGAIVAIAIGSLVALTVISGLVWWLYSKRQKVTGDQQEDKNMSPYGSDNGPDTIPIGLYQSDPGVNPNGGPHVLSIIPEQPTEATQMNLQYFSPSEVPQTTAGTAFMGRPIVVEIQRSMPPTVSQTPTRMSPLGTRNLIVPQQVSQVPGFSELEGSTVYPPKTPGSPAAASGIMMNSELMNSTEVQSPKVSTAENTMGAQELGPGLPQGQEKALSVISDENNMTGYLMGTSAGDSVAGGGPTGPFSDSNQVEQRD